MYSFQTEITGFSNVLSNFCLKQLVIHVDKDKERVLGGATPPDEFSLPCITAPNHFVVRVGFPCHQTATRGQVFATLAMLLFLFFLIHSQFV